MRKLVLLLFTVLLASCAPGTDYSNIKVEKVIDGDTVILENGKMLRYLGIDTPEIRIRVNGEFKYLPQPFSLEAKNYNKELVEGRLIRIEFDVQKTDRYGRLLGYCFLNDTFVNAKMVEEGFAVIYTRPPNLKHAEHLLDLQRQARRYDKGLWGTYSVVSGEQASEFINQIRSVRGKVKNTGESEKCIYLNFGDDWRTDFTVVIFKDNLYGFRERNIDPLNFYKGKTIEATGRIRDYNGPEIIVHHPDEINILD